MHLCLDKKFQNHMIIWFVFCFVPWCLYFSKYSVFLFWRKLNWNGISYLLDSVFSSMSKAESCIWQNIKINFKIFKLNIQYNIISTQIQKCRNCAWLFYLIFGFLYIPGDILVLRNASMANSSALFNNTIRVIIPAMLSKE